MMSNKIAFLRDQHGRKPRYLRLSVTDRCNFKCIYCVSCERQKFIPHEKILRYEEFFRLAAICEKLGTQKARITGGEPFARKGIIEFLQGMRSKFPAMQLAVTTNASLIEPHIAAIASLNLASVNISLDSFDRETFRKISGSDFLPVVLANIERLLTLGVTVKINAVAMAGITDVQMADFIQAARQMPVDIRFIEFMPMGGNTLWDKSNFISCSDLLIVAARHAELIQAAPDQSGLAGPAKMYTFSGAKGRVGFISPVSDHFCGTCNRLRITSEGRLRACLFADAEINLARLVRNPKISDRQIAKAICAAMARKPLGADILAARSRTAVAGSQMVAIGG